MPRLKARLRHCLEFYRLVSGTFRFGPCTNKRIPVLEGRRTIRPCLGPRINHVANKFT